MKAPANKLFGFKLSVFICVHLWFEGFSASHLAYARLIQVLLRLHLCKTARRALELEYQGLQLRIVAIHAPREQLARLRGCRHDQFYALVVEHVNQQRETARFVGAVEPHARHP